MTEAVTDTSHFTKAVTDLGHVRPVVTTSAIFNDNGVKLVEKGVSVHPGLYDRLMSHKLAVPLEDSVSSLPTVTGNVLRDGIEELMKTVPFFGRLPEDGDIRALWLDIFARMPLPEPIAFQLTLACEVRPALYQHSLSTALIAAWLATDAKLSRLRIGAAAAAGLLHDIGMLHLDPQLLEYKIEINSEQRRQLYSHAMVSTVLIERHPVYAKDVVRAVQEHHEFLDGTGYPRNLVGDEISPGGKILALAELISGVFAPGREVPELRLSMLLRMNWHRYDEALVEKVIRHLRPQNEATDSTVSLLDDPVTWLLTLDRVVNAWPADLGADVDLRPEQHDGHKLLTGQAAQLQRNLARAGVTPEQLAQLGADVLGRPLQTELTLLARECAWQLRTLARQTRRRWRSRPEPEFPAALQQWLDQADDVVRQIAGEQADSAGNPVGESDKP